MKCRISICLSVIPPVLLLPSHSFAMHISEGLLPLGWSLVWYAASLPFLSLGLRELTRRSAVDLSSKPLVGMIAAVVFVISCMPVPVPVAGTCSHPCGVGLAAVLLGPLLGIVVAAVALLIQALFMAHGGFSTWGANLFAMGVAGSFAGYGVYRILRRCGFSLAVSAFAAGVTADWATYATTAAILASGIRGSSPFWPLFSKIVIAFIPTQLPLGILEGAMGAGMVTLLARRRPDLLKRTGIESQERI